MEDLAFSDELRVLYTEVRLVIKRGFLLVRGFFNWHGAVVCFYILKMVSIQDVNVVLSLFKRVVCLCSREWFCFSYTREWFCFYYSRVVFVIFYVDKKRGLVGWVKGRRKKNFKFMYYNKYK